MTIIYGLIILAVIVTIHEFGHFFASKACGVKVEAFSVGMGPVLLHKTIRGVDWRLSLLPLGGYCSMKGENDYQKAYEEGVDFTGAEKDSMYGCHPLKRVIIAFAGPFANYLLTVFCFFIIGLVGYFYYSPSAKIQLADEVYPEIHSAARDAGILTGDTIININGTMIDDFASLYSEIAMNPDKELQITVERDGKELTFTAHTDLDKDTGAGKLGIMSLPDTYQLHESRRYGFFGSIRYGFSETTKMINATFTGIASLFKGVKVTNAVSGPARITTMLGETVKSGFKEGFRNGLCSVLNFVAVISISLFLMNLLPIPILDGGLILFSIIELITGKHISPKVRYVVQYIGLAVIAFLFCLAMVGDFKYFMGLFNAKK